MVVSLGNVFHIFFLLGNLFSMVDQTAMKYSSKNVEHGGHTPFFKKDMIVLSEWNRYGRVKKAYRDKKTNKVIVMVSYWAMNIPKTWEIGGKEFPSLPPNTNPNSLITIGHHSEQLRIVSAGL